MKGGYNGLRAKQLSLFLMAVFCTSILIFAWAKSPIFSSLIPPKNRVLKLPPVDDPLEKLEEGFEDLHGVRERIDFQEPEHTTNKNYVTSEAVEEAKEEQLVKEVSDLDVASERIDLQEPDHSTSNNTFTSGSVTSQELKLSVDLLEKERDFYFTKLRDIEILCQTPEVENLPMSVAIKKILYASDAKDSKLAEAQEDARLSTDIEAL